MSRQQNKTHQAIHGRALCQQRFPKPHLVRLGANCCACANAAKVELRKTEWFKTGGGWRAVLSRNNALEIWHREVRPTTAETPQ